MNTRKGRAKFKSFQILLDIRYSSMIVTSRLVEKLLPEKDDVMQWQTQARNITTGFKVKIDFTVPALIVTNVVPRKCHVNEYSRVRYYIILVRDLLT